MSSSDLYSLKVYSANKMAEFKYIMMRIDWPIPRDVPIIFPAILIHEQVFNALRAMEGDQLATATPVAAGSINLLSVECSGKSTTLRVASREEVDENIIHVYPYFHGLVQE